ncbi:unnamed protein product, partial [Larinioides sclopetarius]
VTKSTSITCSRLISNGVIRSLGLAGTIPNFDSLSRIGIYYLGMFYILTIIIKHLLDKLFI